MLVLHFSHVWNLGGVAGALGVGKEDWGLRELGRKAGVPPGRGEGRQTHQSWPTAAAGCVYAHSACSNTPLTGGALGWHQARAWGVEEGSDPARSLAEGKCRKHTGGCLPKLRSRLGVSAQCLTQQAEQTAPFVRPSRDHVNGQ